MKLGLTVGKWALVLVIWIFILLTLNGSLDPMALIQFSIGLFYAIVVITVGFAVFNVAENPKSGIKFIISALTLGLILLIGYNASTEYVDPETRLVVEGSQFTEGGIYTFYTVTIIAVALIFASEIKRALKL